ncbi:MAG TPA: VOC family protein [Candidatus Salinicoccus merdavium]|nr:VOC family protein [Candidatus Salinicoccus merdavium]
MIKRHHHISMYTKDLKKNNHFYTEVLGLRRVKVSVNQNDNSMYHVFYCDRLGTAGNDITYFDMPYVAGRREGTNAHHALGLLVKDETSFDYWQERLKKFGFESNKKEYFGRNVLEFEDTDLAEVDELLRTRGFRTTGVIDRYYFESLYFREDNGVMFEIVGPGSRGFTADTDESELGIKLDLPPALEEKRSEIESRLTPISEWT